MALSAAQAFDPVAKTNLPIFASFLNKLLIMLFLVYNMDHFLIKALFFSFEAVPVGGFTPGQPMINWIISLSASIPIVAFQVVAPIMVVIFLVQLAFGLVSKSVPQINIFFISSTVTIFIGLGIFLLSMPYFMTFMEKQFFLMNKEIITFLKGVV